MVLSQGIIRCGFCFIRATGFRAEAEMPVRRFVARIQERSDGSLAKCTAEMLRRVVSGRACGIAGRLNE